MRYSFEIILVLTMLTSGYGFRTRRATGGKDRYLLIIFIGKTALISNLFNKTFTHVGRCSIQALP